MMTTGNEIKLARKVLRLSQRQLAAICSLAPETLSRIENGHDKVPGYVELIVAFLQRDEENIRLAFERRGMRQ